ncbi:MAG: terminase [Thermodesulfobacteriota bacterium]
MPSKLKIPDKKKRLFLRNLVETASPALAAKAAGLSKETFLALREQDEAFAAAWDLALEEAAELLEAEARRRALEGIESPVFYQGEKRGVVRKSSDALLAYLLKRQKPEKARTGAEEEGSLMEELERKIAAARERIREKNKQE